MRFREKIINSIDDKLWKSHQNTIRKSNNIVDYNSNSSKVNKDDKIKDEIATRIGRQLNTNVYHLFGTQTTYRKRIEQYEYIANFPEVDEALDIIANEVVNFGFNNKIVTQDFSEIGDENIDTETKSSINKIFTDAFIKNYNIRKRMKQDTKKLLIYGELYYQKQLSSNNKELSTVRYINPKNCYPVFWNNQPILFIELLNYETLTTDELDILSDNIDDIIQMKLGSIQSNGSMFQRKQDPTNLSQTYWSGTNNTFQDYNQIQDSMIKVYNPEEIIYIRWDENCQDKNSVQSYLDKIKIPFNRYQTMENQLLLFRMTRSILSYVINIDGGDMSQVKKEELLDKYIDDFNSQEEFNTSDGFMEEIKSVQTAIKHWWFVKGGDIAGTTVDVLDVKTDFSQIEDVLHFEEKFVRALKIPIHRWQSRQESTVSNHLSGEVLNEELEFNNFISDIKMKLETLIMKTFTTRLLLEGFDTTVINESNYEINWSENNFYRLYVNKTITEVYAEMADKLKDYYTPEQILTEVFKLNDAEMVNVIRSRVRHKKYLYKLWDDESPIDEELELYLDKNYFNSNEDYDSKLVKKEQNKDTVTTKYKTDAKRNYFVNAINYVKGVIDTIELEGSVIKIGI